MLQNIVTKFLEVFSDEEKKNTKIKQRFKRLSQETFTWNQHFNLKKFLQANTKTFSFHISKFLVGT